MWGVNGREEAREIEWEEKAEIRCETIREEGKQQTAMYSYWQLCIPDCQGSVFVVLLLLPWNGWLVVLQNTAGTPTQEHVLAHLWLLVSLAQ